MIKDRIQQNLHSQPVGSPDQHLQILKRPESRVYLIVIGSIILMPGRRFKDWRHINSSHAKLLQVCKLVCNALKRPLMVALGVNLIDHRV